MPAASTRRRTRREPPRSESLFHFCSHCGSQFEPNSTPVAGVCQECVDMLYFKHDGSLDGGCELVTHPMSPEYMTSDAGKEMWRGICSSALAEGMRSHDTDTCGLHVHVSREFFGTNQTSQELTELKLIETVDRLFEPIVIFSRRRRHNINQWAPKCNAPKEDAGWVKKAKRVSSFAKRDRYHAINITNARTIDFEGTPMALYFRIATHGAVMPGCFKKLTRDEIFDILVECR